ncbi:MAG: PppA [Clostridia bacterium]|jgi:prepilin signal peptidase PulO-like enzyme (type II secretory pathway)|nr:PppA [Clostridia bacterium]
MYIITRGDFVVSWLEIYITLNVFIIGTLFGSFFTLATYRVPRKQDIVFKRSYCPSCEHELGFFDLIPVLSYLFVGGKCRYCKKKISIRYPLFEISNGLVFVCLYLLFKFTVYFFFSCALYIYLFLITGCYIMNKKMIESEISNIKNGRLNKSKSGVFLVEIAIAFVLFSVFVISSYISSRNYVNQSLYTIARSNAVTSCVKNIEIALGTNYDALSSFTNTDNIDGIIYKTSVSVYKYSDEYPEKKDYIKKINANVEYTVDGKTFNFEINTLKKKVIG